VQQDHGDTASPTAKVNAVGSQSIGVAGSVTDSIINTGILTRGPIFGGQYERLRDVAPQGSIAKLDLNEFVGRTWLTEQVDQFLDSESSGYFILEAAAGLGKTMFMAWLVKERGYIHHFVTPGARETETALRNLAAQVILATELEPYFSENILPPASSRPGFLEQLLVLAVNRSRHGKVVIIVDGLDEAEKLPGLNPLGLPTDLPEGVFILASYRPGVILHTLGPRCAYSLEASRTENLQDMEAYLDAAATRPTIVRALAQSGYSKHEFVTALLSKCSGVWIYLSYVLSEIQSGKRLPLDLDALPFGLWHYYAQYWVDWKQRTGDIWFQQHLPLLGTLGAAEEALTYEKLCAWAAVEDTDATRELLEVSWRPYLTADDQSDTIGVYHASLREFLNGQVNLHHMTAAERALVRQLQRAVVEAHSRIADWHLTHWGGLESGLPCLRQDHIADPDDYYGLRYLPRHLVAANRGEELHELLTLRHSPAPDAIAPSQYYNTWYHACETFGENANYRSDVLLAWQHLRSQRRSARVGRIPNTTLITDRELYYALTISSLNSVAGSVPGALIPALIEAEAWTPTQGLFHASQMPASRKQVVTLAAVSEYLAESDKARVLSDALEVALHLDDESERATSLAGLLGYLSSEMIIRALHAAKLMEEPSRSQLAADAISRLDEPELDDRITDLEDIKGDGLLAWAISQIAPRLSGRSAKQALGIASRRIKMLQLRAQAIAALARYMPETERNDLVSRQLLEASGFRPSGEHPAIFATFVPLLTDYAQRRVILRNAMKSLRSPERDSLRASALATLAPALSMPELYGGNLVNEALDVVDSLADNVRPGVLRALAPYVSDRAMERFLQLVYQITDEPARIDALTPIIPRLPQTLLDEVIARRNSIASEWRSFNLITALAPYARASVRRELAREGLGIAREPRSVQFLRGSLDKVAYLASYLPEKERVRELHQLVGSRSIDTKTFLEIAPNLPTALRDRFNPFIESSIQQLSSQEQPTEALSALSAYTEKPKLRQLLAEVLERTRVIGDRSAQLIAMASMVAPSDEHSKAQVVNSALETSEVAAIAKVIERVGGDLSDDQQRRVADACLGSRLEDERVQGIVALAPFASKALIMRMFEVVKALRSDEGKARALTALTPHLPSSVVEAMSRDAFNIGDRYLRVKVLGLMSQRLSNRGATLVLNSAIASAKEAYYEVERIRCLAELIPYLLEPQSRILLREMLELTSRINYEMWRAEALEAIIPLLPDELLPTALDLILRLRDERPRCTALKAYISQASGSPLEEVPVIAERFVYRRSRLTILPAVMPCLAETEQFRVGEEVLSSATLEDDNVKLEVLMSLVTTLPESLLNPALDVVHTIESPALKMEAMMAIFAVMPPERGRSLLLNSLLDAGKLIDGKRRAKLLSFASEHLSQASVGDVAEAWSDLLMTLATRRRSDLLADLTALRELHMALEGTSEIRRSIDGIDEVGRCWP
jgi:hypothetical protein